MKLHVPLMMLFAAMIGIAGCGQEEDAAQVSGEDTGGGEIATVEAADSTPVEHTTLKPDTSESAVDGESDAADTANDEADTNTDNEVSDTAEDIPKPE